MDLYIGSILPEPRPFTIRTIRFTTVTRDHHPVLDFVILCLNVFEKLIQSMKMLVSCPKQFHLGRGEVVNGFMNGEIELVCHHQ